MTAFARNDLLKKINMEQKKTPYSRVVIVLGIISLINDLGGEIITAILPLFILSLGGTGLTIGLIGGLRDTIASLVKVLGGYWSDKTGKRKRFVVTGYAIASFFKLLLAYSTSWIQLLLFSGLERVGKGIRTAPRDAIVAESMPLAKGKGFGFHRMMDTSGAILGSALAFYFLWLGFTYRSITIFAALITCLALIPLFFVEESARLPQPITLKIGFKKLSPQTKYFIFISCLFSFANFNYMFFILKALNVLKSSSMFTLPLLLYVFFNIFYAAFSIPFGLLSDKIGQRKILLLGYGLFAVVALGFALANQFWILALLFVLYGIVFAIVEVGQRAYISNLATSNLQGMALGTLQTVVGITALPSGLIAGFLWSYFGPYATYLYSTILCLIAFILLATMKYGVNLVRR